MQFPCSNLYSYDKLFNKEESCVFPWSKGKSGNTDIMRITIINAQIQEANNLVPPINILYLAAVLKKEGFELQVLDEDPYKTDIISRVKEFNPDIIGISFLTPCYSRAHFIIKSLKKILPQKIYCAGGVHTTVLPKEVLLDFGLDFCIIGEGEETLLEVCKKIRDKEDYYDTEGICFSKDGEVVITPLRELIKDLDSLPFPATELLDFRKYLAPPGLIRGLAMNRTTAIMTLRGCPFICSFCGSKNVYRRVMRYRSIESVVDEIKLLIKNYKIKGLFILDECFTLNRERAFKLCDELKKMNIKWGCQTRVNLVDEEVVKKLKESGCIEISYGVESGSEKILKILKKGTIPEMDIKAFDLCRKYGVRTTANFMVGNPYEDREDLEKTFKLAKRLKATYTVFHITTPFPGTELYDLAIKEGWLQKENKFDDAWMHRASRGPVMKTNLPKEEVVALRRKFQNHFFIRNYVNWANFVWAFYYAYIMIKHPKIAAHAFSAFLKDRRLDGAIEVIAAESYRTGLK